jgi:hypothetical protein
VASDDGKKGWQVSVFGHQVSSYCFHLSAEHLIQEPMMAGSLLILGIPNNSGGSGKSPHADGGWR